MEENNGTTVGANNNTTPENPNPAPQEPEAKKTIGDKLNCGFHGWCAKHPVMGRVVKGVAVTAIGAAGFLLGRVTKKPDIIYVRPIEPEPAEAEPKALPAEEAAEEETVTE